jgi:flagellar FliJ protein
MGGRKRLMKRYQFALQKVLQLRKYQEDEAKIALGQSIGVRTMIENNIKETSIKRYHAASERFANTAQITSWDKYIARLDQQAFKLAEDAARAELVVEEKRALYLEASIKCKTIGKLREKREKEYRKEMLDSQASEMDYLTAVRK